jgi:hypothetical protein
MPDFSQPGSDGTLPDGFKEWQWGVVYTAGPETRSPLERGREYQILVMTRRRIAKEDDFTAYAELYQRVSQIASTRVADLSCGDSGMPPKSWIAGHSWGCFGEANRMAFAGVRVGILYLNEGQTPPQGVSAPAPAELAAPGPMPEISNGLRLDEIYNDFDARDPADDNSGICLFSYGEYVPSHMGKTFESFMERAAHLAKRHRDLINPRSVDQPLTVVRREWMWATHPDVAVVHVYFYPHKMGTFH